MRKEEKTIGIIGAGRAVRPITASITKETGLISDTIPKDIQGDKRLIMIAQELKRGKARKFIQACNQASQSGGPEDYDPSYDSSYEPSLE